MMLAKVPLVPNYTCRLICTADGGVIYVAAKTICYIGGFSSKEKPPIIKVFHTQQSVLDVDIDPLWNDPDKLGGSERLFAILANDNSVQIWDFDKGIAVSGHKAHTHTFDSSRQEGIPAKGMKRNERKVLISYMRNRNVLSIDAFDLVVYCVSSNTYCLRPMFMTARHQEITMLRCSPYNEHIFAVGTNRGLVLLCDLQQMSIVHTFRGHDAAVTMLSWTSVNVTNLKLQATEAESKINSTDEPPIKSAEQSKINAPESPEHQRVANKNLEAMGTIDTDNIFDIHDYDYLENEFGAPMNCAVEKEEICSDFVGIEKPKESLSDVKFDYAEACQNLKDQIDGLKVSLDTQPCEAVTLADCQKVPRQNDMSSSCGSDDNSIAGSLELIDKSPSDKCINESKRSSKQDILHKAEVHSIQTLSNEDIAKPVNINDAEIVLARKEEAEILLASASIDGTICVWNCSKGVFCDSVKVRSGNHHAKNKVVDIAWLDEVTFISTNKNCELCCFTLVQHNNLFKIIDKERTFAPQSSSVGAIAISKPMSLMWCVTSNREILCENLSTGVHVAKYSCASSNICVMRECPDDMNKIALGLSDRRLGIIDISKLSNTCIPIENFSTHRIEAAIMSLTWSPDSKMIAFGTNEGRVGVVNAENSKAPSFIFNPTCGNGIYSMDWKESYIYVVCNQKLVVYNADMKNKDAQILPEFYGSTAVSVRGDYLFAGTQNGHLKLYRRKQAMPLAFDLASDILIATRYITDIAWSPIATDNFAIASNDHFIHVLCFNEATRGLRNLRKIDVNNPRAGQSCVKWSNRTENEFLTCGTDGAVRVWDLKNEPGKEEKFVKHFHCPMYGGLFLPTDEQIIMCGGRSTSVEFIDMRLEKSDDLSESKSKRKSQHVLGKVQWAVKMISCKDTKVQTSSEKRRDRRTGRGILKEISVDSNDLPKKNNNDGENLENAVHLKISSAVDVSEDYKELAPIMSNLTIKDEEKKKSASNCDKKTVQFCKNPATLLFLTTKELNKDALERLSLILNANPIDKFPDAVMCTKLFGSRNTALQLLAEESRNNCHSDIKGISSILLPQMSSCIKDEILNCTKLKQLTEYHVSVAPTISYGFWRNCCIAFANQLMEQGQTLQAASYLLAIHQPNETIKILLEKNYFKEAMLLARIHLFKGDALFEEVFEKWTNYLENTGNLPGAALLYTLMGQKQRAYQILAKVRKSHPEIERLMELLKPE